MTKVLGASRSERIAAPRNLLPARAGRAIQSRASARKADRGDTATDA